MSQRLDVMHYWIDAVRAMKPAKALEVAAPDFRFYDGTLSAPVTRDNFSEYLLGWESRMRSIGGTGRYEVIDEIIQDSDDVLRKWGWWQFIGTEVQGAAVLKITDQGVSFEKIAYYRAPTA